MNLKEELQKIEKCLLITGGIIPTNVTEKIVTILLGISTIYLQVLEVAAAVGAYEIVANGTIKLRENVSQYISIINNAASSRLMSEIATLFDPPRNGEQENCSLKLLHKMCLQDTERFPLGEQDEMLLFLNKLFNEYDSLNIKRSRNKQLSHHDFRHTTSGTELVTVYEDEELLVLKIGEVLTNIIHRYNALIHPPFPNFEELKQRFCESLESLQ